MRFLRPFFFVLALAVPSTVSAASADEIDRLFYAMRLPEMIQIMREEGLAQSEDLHEGGLNTERGSWKRIVLGIYDLNRMTTDFRSRFDAELADSDLGQLLAFLETPEGQEVVALEVQARRAITDEAVEAAAKERYIEMLGSGSPRIGQLKSFIAENDLVDRNVMGAMNANLAFYRGMADGGGLDLGESQMLSEVWSQEGEIRSDTVAWLNGFVVLAYGSLEDDVVDQYVTLSGTPAGKDLSRAYFEGFDAMFNAVSYALGRATSVYASGEDI